MSYGIPSSIPDLIGPETEVEIRVEEGRRYLLYRLDQTVGWNRTITVNRESLDLLIANVNRYREQTKDRSDKIHAGKLVKELEQYYSHRIRTAEYERGRVIGVLRGYASQELLSLTDVTFKLENDRIEWTAGGYTNVYPTLETVSGCFVLGYRTAFNEVAAYTLADFIEGCQKWIIGQRKEWNKHTASEKAEATKVLEDAGVPVKEVA